MNLYQNNRILPLVAQLTLRGAILNLCAHTITRSCKKGTWPRTPREANEARRIGDAEGEIDWKDMRMKRAKEQYQHEGRGNQRMRVTAALFQVLAMIIEFVSHACRVAGRRVAVPFFFRWRIQH